MYSCLAEQGQLTIMFLGKILYLHTVSLIPLRQYLCLKRNKYAFQLRDLTFEKNVLRGFCGHFDNNGNDDDDDDDDNDDDGDDDNDILL